MKLYSPITMDFDLRQFIIHVQGQKVVLIDHTAPQNDYLISPKSC